MAIQNPETKINGWRWEIIKQMHRGAAYRHGADFARPDQVNGHAQAEVNIVEKMEYIENEDKVYTLAGAVATLFERLPDVEVDAWSSEFTKDLYETYCNLYQTLIPLQDLKKGTYYRCKSGALARVTGSRINETSGLLISTGVIFDIGRNHEGRWDSMGIDQSSMQDGNNLVYVAKDQRSPRRLLKLLSDELESMDNAPHPIGNSQKHFETALELLTKVKGRIED